MIKSRKYHRTLRIFTALLIFASVIYSSPDLYAQKVKPLKPEEFTKLIVDISEYGGNFSADNWITNENSYLTVTDDIDKYKIKGGVYIGVGPDQNFTYINQIQPDLVFIIDVRHLNRMQHLTYKIIFQMAKTRKDYFSLLFSIPLKKDNGLNTKSNISELVDYFLENRPDEKMMNDTEAKIIKTLNDKYKMKLSEKDVRGISYVLDSFMYYGMDITYRGGRRSWYPSYAEFITLKHKNDFGNPFNTEKSFKYLKKLHVENRFIPVTGNFGGQKALMAIGEYIRSIGQTVSAYYVSNVEQYVIRDGYLWNNWVKNVKNLPLTDKSVFIRWTHDNGRWNHQTRLQLMKNFIKSADNGEYYNYTDIIYAKYLDGSKK